MTVDHGASVDLAAGGSAAATGGSVVSEGSPAVPVEPERKMRADAVENRRRILEAAEAVFATHGVSAPIDEVAERAGVGVGTLYRHFSTKEDLFEAIVLARLEELIALTTEADGGKGAGDEFFGFLRALAGKITRKHDLIDALSAAGIDFKTNCADASEHLKSGVDRMLQAAVADGAVRTGLCTSEVLGLVVGVCRAAEDASLDDAARERMLEIVYAGLRPAEGNS